LTPALIGNARIPASLAAEDEPTSMDAPARKTLPGLTIVRFFAALCIVVYHYYDRSGAHPLVVNLLSGGFFPLFFVLSGFMLTYVARPDQTVRDFWARRFARLYPLYFAAWLGTCLVVFLTRPLGLFARRLVRYGAPSLVLAQSWLPNTIQGWNWPSWSMSTEVFFWSLFPLLYPLVGRIRWKGALLIALVVVNALLAILRDSLTVPPVYLFEGTRLQSTLDQYLRHFPPMFLVQFVIGIVLGYLFIRNGPASRWLWVPTTIVTFVVHALPDPIGGIGSDAFLVACYCGLVYALASVRVSDSFLTRGLMALGQAGFATFILQSPVWSLYWIALGNPRSARPFLALLPYLAVLVAVALLAHRYIEVPASRWIGDRLVPGRSARRTAPVAVVPDRSPVQEA